MARKIRVGILSEVNDHHQYRMSVHPNFRLHYKEGSLVYFETIDADGKLKRVTCTVEPAKQTEAGKKTAQERRLSCKEVYNIVQECQTDLVARPTAGKVVYLIKKDGAGA